jgi:putative peptidoglycan lipid II flippase
VAASGAAPASSVRSLGGGLASAQTGEGSLSPNIVGNSLNQAIGTIVSRLTGVGRVVVTAAVLGPTYLGNTYQGINSLPNLVFYGFLAGSLFVSLLVPPLVHHLDLGDAEAARRLACGFLGVALVAFAAVIAVAVLAAPLLLGALSAGVSHADVADEQRRVGVPLLLMLMPQVALYGVAGTAGAVMNSRGRFALPAAAPAIENIGIVATLLASAVIYGTDRPLEDVTTSQLLLLGLGTTASVALHAGAQWWGAWRAGTTLIPRAGWRDPEVRKVLRRVVPSLGLAGLAALGGFAILVVSNRVAGGVLAFALAQNFYFLAIAVAANPIAAALLPRLSQLFDRGKSQLFRDELVRGLALALFLTVPAAVAYAALAYPLAEAISFGEMNTPTGVTLIAASLASIALGVIGETRWSAIAQASYAQRDARSPLLSSALRLCVTLTGLAVALFLHGPAVLIAIGLAVSLGDNVGAWHLWHRITRNLPPKGVRLGPSVGRSLGASLLMAGPAYLVAIAVPGVLEGTAGDVLGVILAALIGAALYFGLQRAWKSPELTTFLGGFGQLGRRRARSSAAERQPSEYRL